jgi:hypothetical protein
MSIEILPSELPRESSNYFSSVFSKLIPGLLVEDLPDDFDKVKFPDELKNAVITYKGELTPNYQYINKFLK